MGMPQGPSWSTLDYGGGWKLGHYFARRFYAPLLLWGHFDSATGIVRLHLVSDLLHAVEGGRTGLCTPLNWEALLRLLHAVEFRIFL